MAYAFEKIMNQMDQGKINVFGQQQGDSAAQANQGPSGGETTKTEAVGDASGGGGASAPRSNFAPDAAASRTVGAQRAFEASKTKAPVSLKTPMSQVSQQISDASQALQDEANKYVTSQTAKQSYGIPKEDLDKAIAGDKDVGARVSSTLSKTQVDPVERFAPKTDYNIEDIEKFQSSPGIASYLRSQFGPSYTAGGAALDVGRLRAAPDFREGVQAMQAQQRALANRASELTGEKGVESQVRETGQKALGGAQKDIREYLGKAQTDLDAANDLELQSWLKDVGALADPNSAQAQGLLAGAQPNIQKRLDEVLAMRPELQKYMTPEAMAAFGFSPKDFIKGAQTGGITAANFYDAGEADRFNRIMGFLGTGGTAKTAGMRPQGLGDVDVEGYVNRAVGAASKRNEDADIAAQDAIKRIMGSTVGRRDTAIANPGIKELAARARVGLQRPEWIPEDIVDPTKFYSQNQVSGNEFDYLSPEDAVALNQAYEELMDPRRVQGGRLYNTPAYTWDEGGYQQAVRDALARMAGVPASPVQYQSPEGAGPNWILDKQASVLNKAGAVGGDISDAGKQIISAPGDLYNKVVDTFVPQPIQNKANATIKNVKKGKVKI
jgi:hypothetical protein